MRTARLLADGREVAAIPLYESLYDVPLSRCIDFLKAREPFDNADALKKGEVNEARVMIKAVGAFFGLELEQMIGVDAIDAGEVADGIESMYAWIIGLLGTFTGRMRTPQDCTFEYKGDVYTIPILSIRAMTGLPGVPADLQAGEMIEAYEIKRLAQNRIGEGDPDGTYLYTYYLQLLAVLARKEGDRLPHSDSECADFIERRTVHFQEIDAGTALDVDFFLAMQMQPSDKTRTAVGCLSNQVLDLVHATRKRGRRNMKRSTRLSGAAKKPLRVQGGARSISKYLNGGGSPKAAKAR
jgi:hypothetical protein